MMEQRRRVPCRLLHFPDEGHWVLKASNRLSLYARVACSSLRVDTIVFSIFWHNTVQEWLETYLQ